MAITYLNPQLLIRIYNGFAEIPDLRQTGITGIAKNLGTFGQKNYVNFSLCPVYLFALDCKNQIAISFGFSIIALQIYRETLKKYRKRAITLLKTHIFKNIIVLEHLQK